MINNEAKMPMAETMLTLRQSYEKRKTSLRLLVLHFQIHLNHLNLWLLIMIWPVKVYFIGTILVMLTELAVLLLVPLIHSLLANRYVDRQHDIMVSIPIYVKEAYTNSFFPGAARLWNSLPAVCFLSRLLYEQTRAI